MFRLPVKPLSIRLNMDRLNEPIAVKIGFGGDLSLGGGLF